MLFAAHCPFCGFAFPLGRRPIGLSVFLFVASVGASHGLLCFFCVPPWMWEGPAFFDLVFGSVCCCLPSPRRSLPPVWPPWPSFSRWCLPLGIWLQLWRLSCPAFVLGVWLCFVVLPSIVSWQQRLVSPVVGVVFTLSTMLQVTSGSSVWPHWGIHQDDDPGPTLVSAKLPYCYSNVIGAAFSAPVLLCHPGTPLLVVCFSAGLSGFALGWSSSAVLRWVGTRVPSSACATLPCPHLGAKQLELRLDCVSIVDRFD